jgi:DNA-binding response OmpR family regulator
MPIRVAIVDSDPELLRPLTRRLDAMGWPHRTLASAVPPKELIPMRLDAIVVDPAVLGQQGWSYLEQLCAEIPHLGIVVCTGQSSVAQRVRGLRLGADDWLPKPCHPEELIARVEAVVRRRRRAADEPSSDAVAVGEIELLPGQFQASVAGIPLELTRREFELLALLTASEGRVLQREEIYERVWGYAMVPGDRSVDVYVRKLRHKLERASPGRHYIHTHFGVGYRFSPAEAHQPAAAEPATPELAGAGSGNTPGHGR